MDKSKRASERLLESSTRYLEEKLKELSSRKLCQSIKPSLERIKVYTRGWLNYYGIASMKSNMNEVNGCSITEYVCVYGNNGNVCEPDTEILR